jgi:pimeloyl-[acyl-carrier protein] methyl ester esterase
VTRTTLVLLPGMDGTGLLFQPFIEAMAATAELTIQPLAYPPRDALDYAALTELAFKALPLTGPLVILGESFSGPIAVALAARCADRVQGLILCCSFVRTPRPRWSWVSALLRAVPLPAPPTALIAHVLFERHTTEGLRALLARSLGVVTPGVLRSRLTAVTNVDASATLAAMRTPLLYLRAGADRLVPPSASAWIKHLRRDVRIAEFDAPHALLQTRAAEAAEAVTAFVRDVSA